MPQFVRLPETCSVFLWLILVVWELRNWENNSAKLVMLHLRRCFDEGFSLSVEICESVHNCLSSRSTVRVMRTVWGIICISIRRLGFFSRHSPGSWTCFAGCIPAVKEMHCVRMWVSCFIKVLCGESSCHSFFRPISLLYVRRLSLLELL